MLAAETNADTARWLKAITLAIKTSGGKGNVDLKEVTRQRIEMNQRQSLVNTNKKQTALRQLAALEVEALKELPLKSLHDICGLLDIAHDPRKDKDRKRLAELIEHQRKTHAAEMRARHGDDDDDFFVARAGAIKTWGSWRDEETMMNGVI